MMIIIIMENPVEQVFQDYSGRRAALIRALTSDLEQFRKQCDAGKEMLCLYGLSCGDWDVNLAVEYVPPEIPEPLLGVNVIRDLLQEKDWILLIASHCDAWLFSVAFFIASRLGFDKDSRNQLFNLINDLPTVSETLRNAANKPESDNKETSNSEQKWVPRPQEEVEKKEDGESVCWACKQKYEDGEFWICCDNCDKWFHGDCMKVTPAMAEDMKYYKCKFCIRNKRRRSG